MSGPWSTNVSRALRETLEAFASEAVTSEVLLNALADGGYDAPPERADDLRDFAHGPLHAEITAVLGAEIADAVVEGLAPVLLMMTRAERDTSNPPAPSPTSRPVSPVGDETGVRMRSTSRPELPAAGAANRSPTIDPPARGTVPNPPPLPLRRGHSTPPARPKTDAPLRPPTNPGLAPRPRAVSGAELVDLAVVTEDAGLAGEVGSRFAGRRFVVGRALAELPRARVVLVDTRHALDELRATWPVGRAPHVAVLWPATTQERAMFEALQPHVPRVVCAGDEAELGDVIMLVALQLSPAG